MTPLFPSGEIGKRRGLKILSRQRFGVACGFDSRLGN